MAEGALTSTRSLSPTAALPRPGIASRPLAAAGTAFFLSGASALVYQVCWQRILALHSGVGIYSIAMIVGSFMAGLGAGSHLGGVLSQRLAPRSALLGFVALELGVAVFGAASCWIYYDFLYLRHASLYAEAWRAGALHCAALLAPTLLMGMSLPLLVRATVRDAAGAGRTVGLLYGVNMLGASAGAWLAPWALMPALGVRGAVLAAVGGNLAAALATLGLARTWSSRGPAAAPAAPPAAPAAQPSPEAAGARPLSLWIVLYALSGFCALSLEILWFRLMDVAVKSTAFTFGTVLAVYLLGSAAGALAGAVTVERIRRPLRCFLLCQCALLAYSAAAVLALAVLPVDAPGYRWFFRYWSGRLGDVSLGTGGRVADLLRLYALLPATLYGLPTVLMGVSFPVLQRAVHDDPATSGRKVGVLQAANIAGCTAGSLAVGLALLTWLGTTGTLRLLLGLGVLFALVGLRSYGRRSVFAAAAAGLAALAVLVPSQQGLWLRLHGRSTPERTFLEEDATSVSALTGDFLGRWAVWVNGKTDSLMPWGGIHTSLGAIPVLVHPAPREVAIIGLGSGDTAWAAGCRAETHRVRVFEVCAPQQRLLRRLAASPHAFPKLAPFLGDSRYDFRVADGRTSLELQRERYDVIEMDALRPRSAYAGNLYSLEFLRLCARRLKPGGLMCSWGPTLRVQAAFPQVFRHVLATDDGLILLGSDAPLPVDLPRWLERLQAARRYVGGPRADDLRQVLERLQPVAPWVDPEIVLNHDLFPRDEFVAPWRAARLARALAALERR